MNKTPEQKKQAKKDEGYIKFGGSGKFNFYWIYIVIAIALFVIYFMGGSSISRELSYTDFQKMAQNGYFEKMVLDKKVGTVTAPLAAAPSEENFSSVKAAYDKAKAKVRNTTSHQACLVLTSSLKTLTNGVLQKTANSMQRYVMRLIERMGHFPQLRLSSPYHHALLVLYFPSHGFRWRTWRWNLQRRSLEGTDLREGQ